MTYLFIWLVFGFAAGSIAGNKNRHKVLWFFIGLLIGPFAALALGIMKPGPGPDQGYQ